MLPWNTAYAFFLVFITPLAIPLAGWTIMTRQVTFSVIALAVGFFCISGLGITLGYHRLLTHQAFQTKPWLKRLLLIMGSFAMQGPPLAWASLHLQHHRHADKEGDPHSPKVLGFWQAHCGWIFHRYQPHYRRFGTWLLQDEEARHVSKYYVYYSVLGLVLPFLIAGWVGGIWAGLLRLFCSCHLTWSVNSICHRVGARPYPISDSSTNHFLIALLTFGEGWHNNHHRFLRMPFLGHHWYQIDIGKWVLLALARLKLVWGLEIPPLLKRAS